MLRLLELAFPVRGVLIGRDGNAAADAEETACCTTLALMTDIVGVSRLFAGSTLLFSVVATAVFWLLAVLALGIVSCCSLLGFQASSSLVTGFFS